MIGTGYVGLVTGTCLADLGHRVTCMDIDGGRIEGLRRGVMPIYEPGLDELVEKNVRAGRLDFSSDFEEAVQGRDALFIAVGTPSGEDGRADLSQVEAVAESLGKISDTNTELPRYVVVKSTVPVGTCRRLQDILDTGGEDGADGKNGGADRAVPRVISCPEFLREGSAIYDFFYPDRIVVGAEREEDARAVGSLFEKVETFQVLSDLESAEMIKYASNAFLATKISFVNEIAGICERTGADVKEVARGMGLDSRIGEKFLHAGLGYGGSCFPKDTLALIALAEDNGYDFRILKAVAGVNAGLRDRAVEKMKELLGGVLAGKTVAVLGLSFKPGTDDLREAPSLEIIEKLAREGARVYACDPLVKGDKAPVLPDGAEHAEDAYEAARGAHGLMLVTEWDEYKNLDLARLREVMAGDIFLDGRNVYEPEMMQKFGFRYSGMGR